MSDDVLCLPRLGDGSGIEADRRYYREELQLAFRNKAVPLETLRCDVTPTGLHYTLIHFDIPHVDAQRWRLALRGRVRQPLSLSLDELKRGPAKTLRVTFECAGDGRGLLEPRPLSQPWLTGAVGTAEWTGVPLRRVLEQAGLEPAVNEIVFTGLDRGFEGGEEQNYQRSLPLNEALRDDVLLAWEMNGAPLEPQHGFPLRLVAPGWYGMTNLKWLASIEAIDRRFEGYQTVAYTYSRSRDETGEPVALMRVRSLMIPPGIPDFSTRMRIIQRATVELRGRAWSGRSNIARVEVSCDAGESWFDAEVSESVSAFAWQEWRFVWHARQPGEFELLCRATDRAGNTQPVEQYWTARGMGNNMAHRVRVLVV